jgi:glutamyl-tRNA(Gln) amidotransferase subunit E
MSPTNPVAPASSPAPIDLNPRHEPVLDFPARELAEMSATDYEALGFLCGLEVHQQLRTRRKLFCRCPSGRRVTSVDAEILRHMRPTLSEMGEYDGCALMEFKTRKEIVYLLESTTVCTYEMDDTPPFEIDAEAVRIALEVSKSFGLNLASELQVMRKQYLDGSIPTGFQRTTMVGLSGVIPFRESELGGGRELRIRQLSLEEDSCREVSDAGHRIVFRTDRLGTPLIETVTEPDLLTPRDVERGGRLLARVARASGKVRRGMGSARQDVNVSIAGSRRVEIKGVGQHRILPRLVHNEAFRHLELLRIRAELLSRGVTPELLTPPDGGGIEAAGRVVDAGAVLPRSTSAPVRDALERSHTVLALRLPAFGGLLTRATQPGVLFLQELAERVRVIACLGPGRFLIASETDAHALADSEWRALRKALRAEGGDALIVLWGPREDAVTAAREVFARCREALIGVPSETRQAHPDGTTGFERILPGPERMYPDTDTPPLPIPDAWLEVIDANRGERPWEREDRYVGLGLTPRAAALLSNAVWADLFDRLDPQTPVCARRAAAALEKRLVHHWRETRTRELPAAERLAPLVRALDEGRVQPQAFEPIFDRLLRETDTSADQIVAEYGPDARADSLELRIGEVVRACDGTTPVDRDARLNWAVGRVLRPLRFAVAPERVRRRIAEALAEAKT